MKAEEIKQRVEDLFGADNGLVASAIAQNCEREGQDGENLLKGLIKLLPGHFIENQTDWNYSNCFSFRIAVQRGRPLPPLDALAIRKIIKVMGEPLLELWLDLSAILPFFRYHFSVTRLGVFGLKLRTSNHRSPHEEDERNLLEVVKRFSNEKGYTELVEDILLVKVPAVRLELSGEKASTTISDCLFHDNYGGYTGTEE